MARFAQMFAASAVAAALAAPAAAQYQYPQQQYPQTYPQQQYQQAYPQQGYGYDQGYAQNQGTVGAIIDSLIGNRYNVSDRQAIHRCADAAMNRAQTQNWSGYPQAYPGYTSNLRVMAITDVQRRSNSVRVRGTLGRGRWGGPGYGYGSDPRYGNNGNGYGRADLGFRCDVDYAGYVRNVRIEPLYRGY
jgi:hypothetical protein